MDLLKTEYMPGFYGRYVSLVREMELIHALEVTGMDMLDAMRPGLEKLKDRVYAEGKWTIMDIILHITDCERIFATRALRFARQDKTPLPEFDENLYALTGKAGKRTLSDLMNEFQTVRNASLSLFKGFDDEQLDSVGIASGHPFSVRAKGYIIAGHGMHHMQVIRERYLTML